jgi:hypothetical protein
LGESAIDDLIEGVDRFLLTRAATKNEDLRDEVILHISRIVGMVRCRLSSGDQVGNTNGLSAAAAKHSTEVLSSSSGGGGHQ